jgi:hypothetical protein
MFTCKQFLKILQSVFSADQVKSRHILSTYMQQYKTYLPVFCCLCSISLEPVPISALRIKSAVFTSRLQQSLVYAVIKTYLPVSQGDRPAKYKDGAERN